MTVGDYFLGLGILINMVVLAYLARTIYSVQSSVSEHNRGEIRKTAEAKGRDEGRDEILSQLAGQVDRLIIRKNNAERKPLPPIDKEHPLLVEDDRTATASERVAAATERMAESAEKKNATK